MTENKSTKTISDDVPLDVGGKTVYLAKSIKRLLAEHNATMEFVFDPREQFLKIRFRFKRSGSMSKEKFCLTVRAQDGELHTKIFNNDDKVDVLLEWLDSYTPFDLGSLKKSILDDGTDDEEHEFDEVEL